MKASEFLETFHRQVAALGGDPEVIVQAAGCCSHAHPILTVELGQLFFNTVSTAQEVGSVVIRVTENHSKQKETK